MNEQPLSLDCSLFKAKQLTFSMDTSEVLVNRSAIKPHPLRPYYTPGLVPNYTSITTNASSSTPSSLSSDAISSNAQDTFKQYARFAGLKFMTTAVLGPFETGKTLLQVQYLPHEDIEVVAPFDPAHPNPIPEVVAEMCILKHSDLSTSNHCHIFFFCSRILLAIFIRRQKKMRMIAFSHPMCIYGRQIRQIDQNFLDITALTL